MIRLVKQRSAENISRFYLIQIVPGLFGQWGVLREWGRIGQPGTVRKDWHDSREEANRAAEALLKAKQKRGYTIIR